ncbi:tyrosine-type recombinase/integrase [Rhodobacteraceae bacterium]|nr:tyrosine-type recombinase/integrase [Paracoccaceae bacterium]
MKKELTDRYLRSLKSPDKGRLEISDTKRPGLRFRLSAYGNAVWMYEKRIRGGPKRKHTLGAWPEPVSLSEAREQALQLEAEAAQGIDRVALAAAKRLEDEAAEARRVTVEEALEAYERLHLSNLRTRRERRRQLNQSLEKHLEISITELTKADLQSAIDAKAATGSKVYANRIRTALLAFSRWAWSRGYIANDIGAGIPRATKEAIRERVLSISEVQEIWTATFSMGPIWGPCLRLLMLTCLRRGEVVSWLWSDIDLDKATVILPGSRTKNGKPQTTHLSQHALQELRSLQKAKPIAELVFTTTGTTPVSGFSRAKKRLDRILGEDFEAWRLHDIRTAFATAMVNAGVEESVADRVLNHSASASAPSAVARVYNQAEQLPQRAAALDRWAAMVTGATGEVVRLAR